MTDTPDALLPCPFCGGEAYTTESGERWSAGCTDCFCNVGEAYDRDAMPEHIFPTKAEAITAWNTRADTTQAARLAALEAEVGRLREALQDVVDPLSHLRRYARSQGKELDGRAAVMLVKDIALLQSIARAALTDPAT